MTARPVEDRVRLEDAPDLFEAPEADEDRARWRIEHPGQLDWAMRKLGERRREQLLVSTRAQAEIDRIQLWAAAEHARVGRDADWFEAVIQEYARDERARDPRRKSISTPYGVVKTREQAGAWDIDSEALLPWLLEHRPHLVNTVQSPRKADVKREFGDGVEAGLVYDPVSGLPVPGVKVGEPTITASVDVDLGLLADDEDDR